MDSKTISYLAQLARLSIDEKDKESLATDLANILAFVDEIQKVQIKSEDLKPDNFNVLRQDDVRPLVSNIDLVEASTDHQDGFIKVPKIL